jgi:hypothetical protein
MTDAPLSGASADDQALVLPRILWGQAYGTRCFSTVKGTQPFQVLSKAGSTASNRNQSNFTKTAQRSRRASSLSMRAGLTR